MYLSIVIHYQHVSVVISIIIRVIYNITRSPNELLKCISEALYVTKYVSDFWHSHWMSVYQVLKSDKIQFLEKLGVLLYVVNVYPVMKLEIS